MPAVPVAALTPFQQHAAKWRDCRRCGLCEGRTNVVLARGKVPCDVLFVGEAPWISEDALAQPFVGPAGHLLDGIIELAWRDHPKLRWAMTNLVACIPRADTTEDKDPPEEAIRACAPRLREMVALCNPRLIVRVGTLAQQWLDVKWKNHISLGKIPMIDITHPGAMLPGRANVTQQSLMVQRATVTLRCAAEKLTCQT
jgi:DNA polymerase